MKEEEKEYVIVQHDNRLNFYTRSVWQQPKFRKLIGGKLLGGGLTLEQAIAMKKLMESSNDSK